LANRNGELEVVIVTVAAVSLLEPSRVEPEKTTFPEVVKG
jgi:hypothetical protein